MIYNPCDCKKPGFCDRHRKTKDFAEWQECLSKSNYRKKMDIAVECNLGDSKLLTLLDLTKMTTELVSKITNAACIIGVARSGLIPASIIATLTHKPLLILNQKTGEITGPYGGLRFDTSVQLNGIVYIVDDSSWSGTHIKLAKEIVSKSFKNNEIKTVAIIASTNTYKLVDLWHTSYDLHLFEWNLFNTFADCAYDFDGVLCRDFTLNEDDDGPIYEHAMIHMERSIIQPKRNKFSIITARLEKYRDITEKWLQDNEFSNYDLYMHPATTKSKRNKTNIAEWKANILCGLPHRYYIESNDDLAQEIAKYCKGKKIIICNTTGNVYQ